MATLGGAYQKIIDNLTYLKSKESLDIIDKTIDYVTLNNLSFIDGFLYFTEAQVEKKSINIINHAVRMAGFPSIKTLEEFDFEYQPSINFTYEVDGKTHHYIPDFKIDDLYFEIKGG